MTVLFQRSAALVCAKPATSARGGRFGAFFTPAPNAITIGGVDVDESLRFTFRAEKSLEDKPNVCDIVIYNAAENSRAQLQSKPQIVRLDVGYAGEVQRLFVGDLRWASSVQIGPTWETRLQLGDGERAHRHARVNRSFKGGVTARQGLLEAAGAMGLALSSDFSLPGLDKQYSAGLAMEGRAASALTDILSPLGAAWSVQDGRLQILRSEDVRKDQAILVSSDPDSQTGLIGSAEYGPPKERGKPAVLTFKMLMYPGLTPGGLVKLETKAVRGLFKLIRVIHEGDTRGPAWYSTCEAIAR